MNWGVWFEQVIPRPTLIVKARKPPKAPEGPLGFDFGALTPKPKVKPKSKPKPKLTVIRG